MDFLYSLDISVFILVNQTLTVSVLDVVMPILTDLNHILAFRIFVLALIVLALWKGNERGWRVVVVLLVALVVSDQMNSFVLKELFQRPRPCHELFDVRLLVDCGGGKSFPSSHAVNAGTIAVVVSFFYPRALWGMLTLAALSAYSRVYVGVHYPSDVIAGLILGSGWGLVVTSASSRVEAAVSAWMIKRRQGRPG